MPVQNTIELKEKIISVFNNKGPSIPSTIARETGLSILFASAFLSELISEKRLKISNMKVGSSPVYFVPGQEPMLEQYGEELKNKEKEAFLLLKEKKILEDKKQEPAIRVALRSIRDFAIPFMLDNEILWRYFKVSEEEVKDILKERGPKNEERVIEPEKEVKENIQEKPKIKKEEKKTAKPVRKKAEKSKKNGKFFDKVRLFLGKKSIEILGVEGFAKNEIILKVKENGNEKIVMAFNKKRINEADIIKAYKKSLDFGIPYVIMGLGDLSKKTNDFLIAAKNLGGIEKIE